MNSTEPPRRDELARNLAAVRERLAAACSRAGRAPSAVRLVAVSKTWPPEDVATLRDLGVTDFGENKDQEARAKAAAVPDVTWHFVGRLQSNKLRSIAGYAALVHSVDRAEHVPLLGAAARRAGRTVGCLVQLSLDGDPARGGVPAGGVDEVADLLAGEPGLRLEGLMAVAPPRGDAAAAFTALAEVSARLAARHPGARVVSAGMSQDAAAAIAAGATHVRIGTALFGHRPPPLR